MDTALAIVRDEGADALTLGRLAARAGVSKPVVYDHFASRSVLLIDLYRWIDTERVAAFQHAMAEGERDADEAAAMLAAAYIACAADTEDAFHAVGAALAGSEDKSAVLVELLDNCVRMFVAVLAPHADLPPDELDRRCIGLVGAGEALAAALVRDLLSVSQAIDTFTALVRHALKHDERT